MNIRYYSLILEYRGLASQIPIIWLFDSYYSHRLIIRLDLTQLFKPIVRIVRIVWIVRIILALFDQIHRIIRVYTWTIRTIQTIWIIRCIRIVRVHRIIWVYTRTIWTIQNIWTTWVYANTQLEYSHRFVSMYSNYSNYSNYSSLCEYSTRIYLKRFFWYSIVLHWRPLTLLMRTI